MPPKSDQELLHAISNLRRVPSSQKRHSSSSLSTCPSLKSSSTNNSSSTTTTTTTTGSSSIAPAIPATILDTATDESSSASASSSSSTNKPQEQDGDTPAPANNDNAPPMTTMRATRRSVITATPSNTTNSNTLLSVDDTPLSSPVPPPKSAAVDRASFPSAAAPSAPLSSPTPPSPPPPSLSTPSNPATSSMAAAAAAAAAALLEEVEEEDEQEALLEELTDQDRKARSEVFAGAARVGQLIRLSEHVVESVAVEKDDDHDDAYSENGWKLKSGLETQVLRSSMFRIITEAAALGQIQQHKNISKPNYEYCNWNVQEEKHRLANPKGPDRRRAMIRRASLLVDGFVTQQRQEKPKLLWNAEEALKELEQQEESLQYFQNGQTSMVLPSPEIPTFTPTIVFVTKGKLRDVVSLQAAEQGNIRSNRLKKFKVLQVTNDGCPCVYCKHPSIFQTQTYQRLSKHKAWTDQSLEGEDDIWRNIPDEFRPPEVRKRYRETRMKNTKQRRMSSGSVPTEYNNPRLLSTIGKNKNKNGGGSKPQRSQSTSVTATSLPLWAIPGNQTNTIKRKALTVKTFSSSKSRKNTVSKKKASLFGGNKNASSSGRRGNLTKSTYNEPVIHLKTKSLQGIKEEEHEPESPRSKKKNNLQASSSVPIWASPGHLKKTSDKRRLSSRNSTMSPHSPNNTTSEQNFEQTPPSTPSWASPEFRNKRKVTLSAPGGTKANAISRRVSTNDANPAVPIWASPGFRRKGIPFGSPKLDEDIDEEELFQKELARLKREAGIGIYAKKKKNNNKKNDKKKAALLSPSKMSSSSSNNNENNDNDNDDNNTTQSPKQQPPERSVSASSPSPSSSTSTPKRTPPKRRVTTGALPSQLPLMSP